MPPPHYYASQSTVCIYEGSNEYSEPHINGLRPAEIFFAYIVRIFLAFFKQTQARKNSVKEFSKKLKPKFQEKLKTPSIEVCHVG